MIDGHGGLRPALLWTLTAAVPIRVPAPAF